MRQPFLIGARLYLRPFDECDIGEEYLQWLNDPEVTRYLGIGRFPETPSSARRYLERFKDSTTAAIFAIIDKASDQHIGNVTLNQVMWIHRTADTSLVIGRKEFWGQGYAFEAWGLVVEYAFRRLGLRKITAGTIAGNTASIHTLQKLGFKIEGVFREQVLVDGEYQDVVRLGLFEDEFHKSRSTSSPS